MSAKKKTHAKSGVKSKPQIECAGNLVVKDFWVKVGFSREELGALAQIAGIFEQRKHRTTGNAAHMVLTTALMHWDKLEPLAFADEKYAEDEGFAHKEIFRAKTIAHKFNLPKSGRAK